MTRADNLQRVIHLIGCAHGLRSIMPWPIIVNVWHQFTQKLWSNHHNQGTTKPCGYFDGIPLDALSASDVMEKETLSALWPICAGCRTPSPVDSPHKGSNNKVYWCVASNLKALRNVLLNGKHPFLCGFLCLQYMYFIRYCDGLIIIIEI